MICYIFLPLLFASTDVFFFHSDLSTSLPNFASLETKITEMEGKQAKMQKNINSMKTTISNQKTQIQVSLFCYFLSSNAVVSK